MTHVPTTPRPTSSTPATRLDGGVRTKPLLIAIGASLTLHAAILAGVGIWGFPAPGGPRTDVEGGVTLLDIPIPAPITAPDQAPLPPAPEAPSPSATDAQPSAPEPAPPEATQSPAQAVTTELATTLSMDVAMAVAPKVPTQPPSPAQPPASGPAERPAVRTDARAQPVPVSFAGSRGHAASRIVYVIDASGAMTASLPIVKQQLSASVQGLSESQQFTVIVPRAGTRDARHLFAGGLTNATPQSRGELAAWLTTVQPGGGSDVVAGLSWALELRPDLIYVLTYRFARTGVASEPSTAEVLARLDALNPRRAGTRPVVIKTIQMISEDPTGLLRAIAEAHGDGEGSYRVLELPKRR